MKRDTIETWKMISDIQIPIKEETENNFHHRIRYTFFKPSGDLAKEHYDYGRGFYNISITYLEKDDKHNIHIYFGTVDDGDFGAWIEVKSLQDAETRMEKIINKFNNMKRIPSSIELNEEFRTLGVYFTFE